MVALYRITFTAGGTSYQLEMFVMDDYQSMFSWLEHLTADV